MTDTHPVASPSDPDIRDNEGDIRMKKVLVGLLAVSIFMMLFSIIRTRDSTESTEPPKARPPNVEGQGQFVLPHFHPKPRDQIDLTV
jgi:hypothetical protein